MTIEINAKWIVRFVLVLYFCYKAVYGAKIQTGLAVEEVNYGENGYLEVGTRKSVSCKAFHKNQRLEWLDPFGNVIKRVHSNRVFAQEHFVPSPKGGRAPGLVLTLTELKVSDSGIYQCKSGDLKKNVSICVIKPSTFVDTPTEVKTEIGRSISLSCQARGEPEPIITWSRNGEVLTEETSNSKYRVNTKYNSEGFESLLTITSLEPEDSGVYTCLSTQESPMLDNCNHETQFNITLQVSHAPIFENGNDTEIVYGKINQVVDLTCSASGYPLPSYRWFKDIGGDTLFEFEGNQIVYSEADNQAVLSVTAGLTTFGSRYKCKATNSLGDADKYFMLLKMEKPRKASEVLVLDASENQIDLNVTWIDDVLFPIDEFDIQFMKASNVETSKRIPPLSEWKKSTQIRKKYDEDVVYENMQGTFITLDNLIDETEYWIRLRAVNNAGEAPWSDPILAETTAEVEEEEEVVEEAEEASEEKPIVSEEPGSDGTFYGIFFVGGIIIVGVACMFVMRLV